MPKRWVRSCLGEEGEADSLLWSRLPMARRHGTNSIYSLKLMLLRS